eukprot:gene54376-8505_t
MGRFAASVRGPAKVGTRHDARRRGRDARCPGPQVAVADMQRFVAMIAEAAHGAGRKVTTGSASLKWSSHAQESEASYWDDDALRKAYPSAAGAMDFYNIHYYDWMYNTQWGYDPMRANTSHWQLDKPAVIGELPAHSQHYSVEETLTKSIANGFAGLMFWAYNDDANPVATAIAPLRDFAKAHGATYDAQKAWGKCDAAKDPWMVGFCCRTCFACAPGCGKAAFAYRTALNTEHTARTPHGRAFTAYVRAPPLTPLSLSGGALTAPYTRAPLRGASPLRRALPARHLCACPLVRVDP